MSFALSPFKPFLAAKTLRVREFMVDSWARYFREGWLDHASLYAQAMYGQHKADGMSADDLARAQVGHSFGIISTTGPVTWWMLYHIFSDQSVLNDVVSPLYRVFSRPLPLFIYWTVPTAAWKKILLLHAYRKSGASLCCCPCI